MRIDRKRRPAERLGHYHACRLVAHARQPFERFDVVRNAAAMLVDEDLREPLEIACFARRESAASDDLQHFMLGHARECLRSRRAAKKSGVVRFRANRAMAVP